MQRDKVLIAGGGPAALECGLALRALGGDRVEVELLSPDPAFVYRPLTVRDPFRADHDPPLEIAEIARSGGFSFRRGRLARIDSARSVVRTDDGTQLRYDALVLAVGARPLPAVHGALTLSGAAWRDHLTDTLMRANLGTVDSLAFVVPPGVVWPLPAYELALMSAEQLRRRGVEHVPISLVTSEHEPLGLFGSAAAASVSERLASSAIELSCDAAADRAEDGKLLLRNGRWIAAQVVLALPRLEGPFLPGAPHDTSGFIQITPRCEVAGLDDVYAAGDATDYPVKQGDIAMQQADLIAQTIVARLNHTAAPERFEPELRGVLLTSFGAHALAIKLGSGTAQPELLASGASTPKLVGRYLGAYLATRAPASGVPAAAESARPTNT